MTPNDQRPTLEEQVQIVETINYIGFNPYLDKPIHLLSRDEVRKLKRIYKATEKENPRLAGTRTRTKTKQTHL